MKKSLLFYNLYPKNNWKRITEKLLEVVPHDEIIVHVSMPLLSILKKKFIIKELRKYPKVTQIIFSINKKKEGESIGFNKMRESINLDKYALLTYIHSKGSSKKRKNTPEIRDWTEYMRYFVVEDISRAQEAFNNGYSLYGVNLFKSGHKMLPNSTFHFSGNFVTINLNKLREKMKNIKCESQYFAVEMYWGKLCDINEAFCAHQSNVNHYDHIYPPMNYRD